MKSPVRYALALVSLLAFAAPAYAQDPASVSLVSMNGNVMVSGPGDTMVSATPGQTLAANQTIVVPQGATATVSSAGGNVTLSAGTYTVGPGGAITGSGTITASGAGGGMGGGGVGAGGGLGGAGGGLGGLGGLAGVGAGLTGIAGIGAYQAHQNSTSNSADDIIDPAVSK